MDWDELASSELPSITVIPPAASNLSQFQQSNKNAVFATTTTTNPLDTLSALHQPNSTHSNDDPFRPAMETLDDLIRRYEYQLFSSTIQRYHDETRQRTAEAIDNQLQQQWDKVRDNFTKNSRGEINGKKNHEWSKSSPFHTSDFDASLAKPDPSFILAHWRIVERMNRSTILDCIEKFSHLSSDASRQNRNSSSMMAYESAWQLVACLVGARNSPIDQARGTLTHFCQQFQVNVINRVRRASLAGQNTDSIYTNDFTAQCEVFTRLTVGTTDPWAVCFYCLRCGDANAALPALEQIPQLDEAVRRLLVAMTRAQGNSSCLWDGRASILRLDRSDQETVGKQLEDFDARAVSTTGSEYKTAVLQLLSGSKPWPFTFEPKEGFQTIEDYLTGALWVSTLQTNPVDRLIQIADELLQRGASSFGDPSSGGWSFALPLLATQQYQKALIWLAQSGGPMGLLHAVHIGLVLSYDGFSIRNLGHTDSIGNETIANLLLAYSNEIVKEHGPLVALDYLVHIPNNVRAYKEIAKLIVAMDDITPIAGYLDSEGMRQSCVLSKYFKDKELSLILIEASEILSLSTSDRHKQGLAVMCLMLAHRYDDVLSMLNHLIAPPNVVDNERKFWLEQVATFHSHYIGKRTRVLEFLESHGKISLVHTSQLLVELNLFFERSLKGENLSECLVIAKKTHLLPETEADRKIKESQFRDLDPLVQESMPFLLIGVMKILKDEHTKLKREMHRDTDGVVRGRVKELNENARLLTLFASCLGIAKCHVEQLTYLMSLMI